MSGGLFRLSPEELASWERDGYLIVRNVFSTDDVSALRNRFDDLGARGEPIPGFFEPERSGSDPLKRFPRVMHPHRWDDLSRRTLLHPNVERLLFQLLGEEAVACQTMFYFKAPGSAGQSFHQDNMYLAVAPGTCIAAWTALDDTSPVNGGLYVVPGTHRTPIECPDTATLAVARNGANIVDPPAGLLPVPALMKAGSTLFFNGNLIHGSGRNESKTEWRRSFIAHYMPRSARHINAAYLPVLDFSGAELAYDRAPGGGPCGEALGNLTVSYGVDAVFH